MTAGFFVAETICARLIEVFGPDFYKAAARHLNVESWYVSARTRWSVCTW